jgi:integral membrane protein (TIGR01906 family)
MRLLKSLAGILFVILVPLFLFGANLLFMVLDVGTYERAFFGYGAAERTGLSADELRSVAASFATHIRDGTPIVETVARDGQRVPMFSERELVHMRDVHDLVSRGLVIAGLVGAYFVAFAVLGRRWWQGHYAVSLSRYVRRGAILTLALLLGVAGLTVVAFDQLFWVFHVVSFPNDYWLMDPRQHYLINLFSQQFFLDTTLVVAGMTAVEAVVLLAVATGVIWWGTHNGRVRQESGSRAS